MTTNEESTIRPIEDLLKLNSYSLMSDDEIDAVIAYKQQIAYSEGIYQQQLADQRELIEAQRDMYKQQADHANAILEKLIEGGVQLDVQEP